MPVLGLSPKKKTVHQDDDPKQSGASSQNNDAQDFLKRLEAKQESDPKSCAFC